jgi:predicted thioredoxin/glutaredoxin
VTALTVWSREGCTLCDELLAELAPWAAARGLAIEVRDVDDDATAKRRYGLRVPVVALDGAPVCHGRLDLAELERLLAGRP